MKHKTVFTAANGVGVVIDTEYYGKDRPFLRVISPCCGEEIHWDIGAKPGKMLLAWNCSACSERVAITPGNWASVFDMDPRGARWPCEEWLAEWFGVPADQVTVVISS